jgi:adenylosuccinate synthase
MKELEKRLQGSQIVAIICNQWGDSGKGKVADYLAPWADVYARGTGGPNAGHTVVINGKQKIYHQIPTGIVNDSQGKPTILGNGMVINLKGLSKELNELDKEGMSYNHLMISKDAHVIMPYQVKRDQNKNQSMKNKGIGSTGRGIGPTYAEKVSRRGIPVSDLFNKDRLVERIEKIKSFYPNQKIDTEEIITELQPYIEKIKPFVRDTVNEMHDFLRQGKKVMIEGAQGLLLSIEHGTYPYVTSSDCSINGNASGIGISARDIDLPIGIVKFPFMTRVGGGPFPTEFAGEISEEYCAAEQGHRKLDELKEHRISHEVEFEEMGENAIEKVKYDWQDPKIKDMINYSDQFRQGVGVRLAASEYGATTGRPRRTGWTDAVSAKYAVGINGPLMFLTKADCLSGADEFNLSFGYKDETGRIHENFNKEEEFLRNITPEYKTYMGYGDIQDIRDFKELPKSLKQSIRDFEQFTYGSVIGVSVGADREETILR